MTKRFITGGSFTGAVLACIVWAVEWSRLAGGDFAWTRAPGFEGMFYGLTTWAAALYLLVGSVAGALLGFVASLGVRGDGWGLRVPAFFVPAILTFPVWVFFLFLINREYLPQRYSPQSFAGNGALALAALGVALLFAWLLLRYIRESGGWARKLIDYAFAGMWIALLALVIVSTYLWNSSKPTAQADPSKPNVLLVLLETTRADHVGCYGYERNTTPNIDRLGAEGAVFEQYHTNAPFSGPSKATLATGLFPHHNGVRSMPQTIRDDVTTIAEAFEADGYRTAGFASGIFMDAQYNYHKGYMTYESLGHPYDRFCFATALRGLGLTLNRATPWYMTEDERTTAVDATRVIPRVLDWVDTRASAPFYMLVEFNEPHLHYIPPPPFDTLFTDPDVGTVLRDDILYNRVARYDHAYNFEDLDYTAADVAQTVALYDGEIAYVDWAIGKITEGLRERGILDNTIVVVTADHGENFGEHGTWFHHTQLYEQSIHVPMVVRYPARIDPVRVEALVQEVDVFPTLMELAGVSYPGPLDGVSMMRKLEDDVSDYPLFAEDDVIRDVRLMKYANYRQHIPGVAGKWRAVREGDWKLIYIPGDETEYELYNVARDPLERDNLIDAEPEVRERLRTLLDEWMAQDTRGDLDLDPEVIKQRERELRALGYIQ